MTLILLDASTGSLSLPMIIAIIAFILSGLLLASAIVLFIKFKIPELINDLSGKAAQKRIKEMRDQGMMNTQKSAYRPSPVRMSNSTEDVGVNVHKPIVPPVQPSAHTGYTVDIGTDLPTGGLDGEATEHLEEETSQLGTGALTTASLDFSVDGGTEVLEEGTAVLTPDQIKKSLEKNKAAEGFETIQSIVLVHTNETI